ncbi:MAG: DNA repair protein RecO [Clostridia bacterium]|nr:DNA repair protein RecO [Clostridia bacterium]
MRQTERTAIVLRYANYRDNDRMLTLFSPTQGRIEALARGCRKSRSPILNASEMFALGDFELYQKGAHLTVISANLIETFYPLRQDFDRLAVGTYLLGVAESFIQPGVPAQELFMLLLHTLSRLTFSDQPWKPLVAGFLLHLSASEGFKPRLQHCVHCGKRLTETESTWFDHHEGGLVCRECHLQSHTPVSAAQAKWMRTMLTQGSAAWLDSAEATAPFKLLRKYVESRLDRPVRSGDMLPEEG